MVMLVADFREAKMACWGRERGGVVGRCDLSGV